MEVRIVTKGRLRGLLPWHRYRDTIEGLGSRRAAATIGKRGYKKKRVKGHF
jgi:hypothetical protein